MMRLGTRGSRRWLPLLGLFMLASMFRLIGVDWHGFHPDEAPGTSARMLTGQLTGYILYYPPLLNYLVAVAYGATYAFGRAIGWWHSSAAFRDLYFGDRTIFFVVARGVAAACSALAPPLLVLLARTLRIGTRWAWGAGLVACLVPGEIFWSHVDKGDVALAAAYLLVMLAAFRLLDRPEPIGRRLLMALALALAVSFKQSAMFFLIPFMGMVLVASLRAWAGWRPALVTWGTVLALAGATWAVLNIGILLDLAGFLDAQRTQSQMSLRHATAGATAGAFREAMTSGDAGLSPVLLIAAPIFVAAALALAPNRIAARRLAMGVAATAIATALVAGVAGDRQPHHLLLPFATLLQLSALLGAGMLAKRRGGAPVGAIALAAVALASVVRLVPIYRQFASEPVADRAARSIAAHVPTGARILTAIPLPALRQSSAGAGEVRARDRRLGERYGVALPPSVSPEHGDPAGYVVRPFPFAIGGMEHAPEDARVLLPYAWPIQQAEWRLPYWRAQGYRWFLIDRWFVAPEGIPAYRNLFSTIMAQCRPIDEIATARPLLWERGLSLYDCG